MAEIERSCRAQFKRVAAGGNVVQVQFRTAINQLLHRRRLERNELFDVAFDFRKELCVADAGHFHGLDVAGAFVTRFQRGEQIEIVDDHMRRRERTGKIFFAKGVDAIFHADAGIGLAQGGGGDTHMADAAVRGGRGETGDIEQCAAADGNQVRMPVNMIPVDLRMDFRDVNGGIFGALTALNNQWRANQFYIVGVGGKVIFDPACQIRLCLREGFIENNERLP